MKFLLYLEPYFLTHFLSKSGSDQGSGSDRKFGPASNSIAKVKVPNKKIPIEALPDWMNWFWEHKHGQPIDASVLWRENGKHSNPKPKKIGLPPAIPKVILIQRPYGQSLEDQGFWPKGLELTDDRVVLILQTQRSKNHITLLRGSKRLDWPGSTAPADILKGFKAEFHWAARSAHDQRRLARQHMHEEGDAGLAQSFEHLVQQHYRDKLCSIPQLAKLLGISGTRLQQICQKHFEMGPKAYLVQSRVHQSCEHIRKVPENRRCVMSQIAGDCGFSSSSYFSYIFMSIMGMTPTEYRHQQIRQMNESR